MKEHIKAPEKIQLSDKVIVSLSLALSLALSLSDAQFKTLVIRMLQELTGYFNSIKKTQAAMKVALCEIKKNLQGTNSEGKETRTQINGVAQKEEIRIQKYEERLRNLQDIFKHSNIRIIGGPEEKKKSKKLKTYLKK